MSDLSYSIKRSRRARSIRIAVRHSGEVVVTVPALAPAFVAHRFIEQKMPWIVSTRNKLQKQFENKTIIKQTRKDYLVNKRPTLEFIKERVSHFNSFYRFKIGRIAIKNQKSRWGSCSSKGNLNFSYSLIHLPKELADYIVVHELCHLKEMNHSQRFWNLVAEAIPNHRQLRAILRKNYITVQ